MITLCLPSTDFLLKEICVAFCGFINTVVLLVPFKQTLFRIIDLPNKNWVGHGMRNLEIWTQNSWLFHHNPFLHFLHFSCWYVFKMSGMGENTSDPSRAESRKRKDPDQLGPRLDHLYMKTLKEKDFKKKKKKSYTCTYFSVRKWQTCHSCKEKSVPNYSDAVILCCCGLGMGGGGYCLLLLFVCLFWVQCSAKIQNFGDNIGAM